MNNLSIRTENIGSQSSPFDSIRGFRGDGSEYWTGRELMKWLGYTRWEKGHKALLRACKSLENQGHDVGLQVHQVVKYGNHTGLGVREIIDYELSRLACYTVAMNADPEKEMVALAQGYFANQTRKAEVVIPSLQSDLDKYIKLEELRARNKELDNAMLIMHGQEVVLALAGKSDAIVKQEVVVTEVINLNTGTTDKFLSAEQLKVEVQKRTGQKVKSLKSFTDAIRKAGRDDLLIPVTRSATSEYISPDRLNEAIAIVYGDHRQQLIGQRS